MDEHGSRVVGTYVSVHEVTSSIPWVARMFYEWHQVSGTSLTINYQNHRTNLVTIVIIDTNLPFLTSIYHVEFGYKRI